MSKREDQRLRTEYTNRFNDLRKRWKSYLNLHLVNGRGYSRQMHVDFILQNRGYISKLGELHRALGLD